jgi:hypothetical protein
MGLHIGVGSGNLRQHTKNFFKTPYR